MHHILCCRSPQGRGKEALPKAPLHACCACENLAHAQRFILTENPRRHDCRGGSPFAGPAGSKRVVQGLPASKWSSCRRVWSTISARATLTLVMTIAEIVENMSAITVIGVAKLDHFAKLTSLQIRTPC